MRCKRSMAHLKLTFKVQYMRLLTSELQLKRDGRTITKILTSVGKKLGILQLCEGRLAFLL